MLIIHCIAANLSHTFEMIIVITLFVLQYVAPQPICNDWILLRLFSTLRPTQSLCLLPLHNTLRCHVVPESLSIYWELKMPTVHFSHFCRMFRLYLRYPTHFKVLLYITGLQAGLLGHLQELEVNTLKPVMIIEKGHVNSRICSVSALLFIALSIRGKK